MVRSTDRLRMTIAVDLNVKPQTKQTIPKKQIIHFSFLTIEQLSLKKLLSCIMLGATCHFMRI